MRIALVQKSLHPNNAGIIAGLRDRGHDLHLVLHVPPGTRSAVLPPDLAPVVVPYRTTSVRRHAGQPKRLSRLGVPELGPLRDTLREFRPDVVIAKGDNRAVQATVQVARLLRATPVMIWDKPRTARKARALSVLGPLVLPRRKIHMGYFGEIGSTVRLGGLLGRSLLSTYPVETAEQGLDHLRSGAEERPDGPVRLVAIGSLDNRVKRLDWIIDAIADGGIADRVEVTFIGIGSESSHYYRAIRERETARGVQPSTFLLNLSHDEVLERLPSFDILVHPSLKGLADAVIGEAMARGVAPICSERVGTRICFEDGVSGLVFRSDSHEDFTARLVELVNDDERRSRMRRAALERAERLLTPEAWAIRFEELVAQWPPAGALSA